MKKCISIALVILMFIFTLPLTVFSVDLGQVSPEGEYVDRLGDVNCDGTVNSADAYIVKLIANNLDTLNENQKMLADIDSDGQITLVDARLIFRIGVGLEAEIPIETNIEKAISSCFECSPHFNIKFDESNIENDELIVQIRFSGLPDFTNGDFNISYSDFAELTSISCDMKNEYGFDFVSNKAEDSHVLASVCKSDFESADLPDNKINFITLKFNLLTDEDVTISIAGTAYRGTNLGERKTLYVEKSQGDICDEGIIDKGKCGTNLNWTLSDQGTLTISGEGNMGSFWIDSTPWMFYRNDIQKVVIEDGVTSIGEKAFVNCDKLQEVTISDSVTYIDYYSFVNCNNITDIYYKGTENQWGNITIRSGNESLTNATIHFNSTMPEETTTVPEDTTAIPEDTTAIPEDTTAIPEDTTAIPEETTVMPEDTTAAPEDTTAAPEETTTVPEETTTVPEETTTVPEETTTSAEGTIVASGVCGENLTWTLDDTGTLTISGTGVMTDYYSSNTPWLNHRDTIKHVTIADGVESIGNSTFEGCISLQEIIIPDSVKSIGDWAFAECRSLQRITIPDGVTYIGEMAFRECSNLQKITIPDSVTSFGDSAFYGCSSLQEITIPKGVTIIDKATFAYCHSLTEITIPYGVTHIDDSAFFECLNLQRVTIPDSVTNINGYAFAYCRNLQEITIPDSVIYIEDRAFCDCSNLKSFIVDENNLNYLSDESGVLFNKQKTLLVQYPIGNSRTEYIIPEGVTDISNGAFDFCINLQKITIPDGVTCIGERAFAECENLQEITIPDSVTSIGDYAFLCCVNLQKITIPDGVTCISNRTFFECNSLQKIAIPDSVTNIGDYAFCRCWNLADVYYEGTESLWNEIHIDSGNEYLTNATIHFNSTMPEETTTVPEETTVMPEETTVVPEETTMVSEETTMVPEETTAIPEETTVMPEDTTAVPEETTAAPEETTIAAEEATTAPDTSDDTTEEKNFLETFWETLIDIFFKAIEWLKNLFN